MAGAARPGLIFEGASWPARPARCGTVGWSGPRPGPPPRSAPRRTSSPGTAPVGTRYVRGFATGPRPWEARGPHAAGVSTFTAGRTREGPAFEGGSKRKFTYGLLQRLDTHRLAGLVSDPMAGLRAGALAGTVIRPRPGPRPGSRTLPTRPALAAQSPARRPAPGAARSRSLEDRPVLGAKGSARGGARAGGRDSECGGNSVDLVGEDRIELRARRAAVGRHGTAAWEEAAVGPRPAAGRRTFRFVGRLQGFFRGAPCCSAGEVLVGPAAVRSAGASLGSFRSTAGSRGLQETFRAAAPCASTIALDGAPRRGLSRMSYGPAVPGLPRLRTQSRTVDGLTYKEAGLTTRAEARPGRR